MANPKYARRLGCHSTTELRHKWNGMILKTSDRSVKSLNYRPGKKDKQARKGAPTILDAHDMKLFEDDDSDDVSRVYFFAGSVLELLLDLN